MIEMTGPQKFKAKIIADSLNPCGNRLITYELTYPRIIHSEMLTHRMFSRNSASSRAIPVAKMIQNIKDEPFIPIHWGKAQTGMQAFEELPGYEKGMCQDRWLTARDDAIYHAERMLAWGLHKQIANRILEPWMWITVILSTTNLRHFRELRCHEMAEPHFQKIAGLMVAAADCHTPTQLAEGEWHLPFIEETDFKESSKRYARSATTEIFKNEVEQKLIKVSVGRCARVSYLTHDGRRDHSEDIKLHDKLIAAHPKHASPTEHQAMAMGHSGRRGNFVGFKQYRKFIEDEYACEARETAT